MNKIFSQGKLAAFIVAVVLIVDQAIKIWVKTNMFLHQNYKITDCFYIYFTENNGMAFGLEIFAKLFLTIFRIAMVILITWYIARLVRQPKKVKNGYIVCLSLVLAGAIGNIIDCVFYGEIFSESTRNQIASFVPIGEGYANWPRDMPIGYMVKWWICSISLLLIPTGRTGCLLLVENILYSSALYSILPMLLLVVVS